MSIFHSTKNLLFGYENFIRGNHPKLLIIGYSGSGKTTFARQLAEKYNVKYINLDDFFFQNQDLKKADTKLYKQKREEFETSVIYSKDRAVIEGVGIMRQENPSIYKFPTVVLGTSLLKSSYRGAKRNLQSNLTNNSRVKELITPFQKNISKYYPLLKRHLQHLQETQPKD